MEITTTELIRLTEALEKLPADLTDREQLVLREVFRLAMAAVAGGSTGGHERAESRSPGLIALRPEPSEPPEEGNLPSIMESFEDAFQPGAAASFDVRNSAPGEAGPERVRITARLV